MDALVGYSGSSESDSDGESFETDRGGAKTDVIDGAAPHIKTRNFLLESASSESDQSEHEGTQQPPSKQDPSTKQPRPASTTITYKLPPPRLQDCTESSVFANPFKAQAEQKLSALQKHVPLTMQAKPSQIGGKRICASYRKDGRCRFGIKCKFAHDSDLQTGVIPNDYPPTVPSDGSQVGSQASSSHNPPKEAEQEGSEGRRVKKRRVGVSDTLIPPKQAMKQYNMLRGKEKLNMY
ncbi:uncharacterized protein si:ch211-113e8.11 [Dunckerocampus dactyliophorus]|uniref:uncharacterized protein si:ch211-113e8.11 n=1 Tax=Dunckerocampus dactyliophorus TaxID=161453 RepID=UPI002406F5E2|nr:uncharacterized protein si:ch211-113e8.11 [Dunckerocampus dactyliophorus]